MARLSNVGNPSVYEAGDQRNVARTMLETERELHQTDEDNPMGFGSKMAAEHRSETSHKRREAHHKKRVERETERVLKDPTEPARYNLHEPSRGAKMDRELQEDDERENRNKGRA